MNQNLLKTSLAAVAALTLSGVASIANAASTSADATATVVAPISISKTTDLAFGSFTTSAASQTVTISAAGARSLSGATPMTGAVSAASFNVTGSGSQSYVITLPSSGTMTTGGGAAAETMAVSGFTSNPSATGTLSSGAQTLLVGATLTTVATQAAGVYNGSFSVSVEYN